MSGSKDFPAVVTAAFSRALVAFQGSRSNADVGRAIGVSPQSVAKGRGGSVGRTMATGLVKAMGKKTLREIVVQYGDADAVRVFDESEAGGAVAEIAVPPERYVEREERYPALTDAFRRARAAGVDDRILDSVRGRIGQWKSEKGPSEAEVEAAIAAEVRETARVRRMYAADDLDEALPKRRK